MKGYVYIYTNKVNSKVYIGQTINLYNRKIQHKNAKDNLPFHCAIRKYGLYNFDYSVLKTIVTYNHEDLFFLMNFWEKFYIKEYKSNDRRFGYNIESGGNNTPKSEETKEKFKKNHCNFKGKNHPQWGTHLSNERKQKLREYHSIPIVQLSLDGDFIKEWTSSTEASFSLGFGRSGIISICKCAKGEMLTYKGFIFIRKKDYTLKAIQERIKLKHKPHNCKPVYQYTKEGTFIKKWNTRKEAEVYYNASESTIYHSIKGNYVSLGYRWSYNKVIKLEIK
jgi:group I intron endonuclease